jgi:hypothetical protein
VFILNLRYVWIIEPFHNCEGECHNVIYEMSAYTDNQDFLSDVKYVSVSVNIDST